MHNKATSAAVAIVATAGFALAAFIPTASAQKTGHAATTCPTGPASAYCEGTTTTGTGTTAVTTTTTTTSTTANPAGVTVPKVVGTYTASQSQDLTAGTDVGGGVTVESNSDGALVLVCPDGTVVSVSVGAAFSTYDDGSVFVVTTAGGITSHILRDVKAVKSVARIGVVTGYIAYGGKAKTFVVRTAPGVTFGAKSSKAQILKQVTFYNGTKKDTAAITALPKFRGSFTGKLATATSRPVLKANSAGLRFTKYRARYLKAHKIKKTAATFKVTTTAGKSYKVGFSIPITAYTIG